MTLHEQLDRIAEDAPLARVPADTWTRARRARRRDVLLTTGIATATVAATIVAVILLALGGSLPLPQRLGPPVAGGGAERAGVPDHLYPVPGRLTGLSPEHGWTSEAVTGDVAVGRAAAAWLAPAGGPPVVVDATDGAYHLLDLPGFAGNNWFSSYAAPHSPTIALSPDGRRLAYSWARFGPDSATEPIPSGIRVLDLATGEVHTHPLPGAEGTMVERIVWSPDGAWLGWAGARLASWTRQSMGGGTGVVGRIRLADGVRQEHAGPGLQDVSIGIDDTGTVALGDEHRLRLWDGTTTPRAPVGARSGQRLAAGPGGRWAVAGVRSVAIVTAGRVREAATSAQDTTTGSQPLGWVGGDVLVVTEEEQGDGRLVLTRPGGAARQVAEVETGAVDSLSVATDLMTASRPTVRRPAPDWPWSVERWALVLGVPALALLLGAWWFARYRARSARSARSAPSPTR